MSKYFIPQAPDDLYMFPSGRDQIIKETADTLVIDMMSFEDGINIYVKGAEYPKKGFPTPDAIWACNLMKRFIMKFPLMLYKLKDFNDIGMKVISPYILKEEYMTPIARTIGDFIFLFLTVYGYDRKTAEDFSRIFSHLIEYDNAYRYRIEDIMSETTREKLSKKPIREIRRLLKILSERDYPGVAVKFKKLGRLIILALMIPKVRKAFRVALDEIDFYKLQYDEADRYWCAMRQDYNFFGMKYEDRKQLYKQYPTGVKVENI